MKRLWRSSGKLNLSLEHAKRTPNRPLVFIFTPFANSMEIFLSANLIETHVINLFVQHFATLNQLPQPSQHLPLATCHLPLVLQQFPLIVCFHLLAFLSRALIENYTKGVAVMQGGVGGVARHAADA